MASHFSDFWLWWAGILGDLFSRFVPWRARRQSGFRLVISAETATLFCEETAVSSTKSQTFPLSLLSDRLAVLRTTCPAQSGIGTIRLEAGRFVLRQLSPLALPLSRLQSAAALDLSESTPFKAGQMLALPVTGAVNASCYAIVKNSVLVPVLSAFNASGVTVAGIEFEAAGEEIRIAHGGLRLVANRRTVGKSRLAIAFASLMVIAIGATVVHAYLRNDAAIGRLIADVETLGTDAKIARKALDQRAAAHAELMTLRGNIEDSRPVAVVWEELARVVPDTAYLTDFSIKSGQVTMAGYAEAAAELVVALEQSQGFSEVGFLAPVIKTPGVDGERFEISLDVGG